VIYGDLFRSQYTLPWHLTTLEAVKEYYRILNPGGCMLVNIISSIKGPGSEFLASQLYTFEQIFPYVSVYAVNDHENLESIQSMMLVAVKSEEIHRMKENPIFSSYLENEVTSLMQQSPEILTDDHAPVDYFMGKAIH
jgi:ubiquinone/menaquinone biosynthesis C-methylase UbiE